ncbi:MAG: S1 RNA-binding domain-containing protein [Candidatus Pacebacteria bacterium]|jgi:small subunit ribosomal protein S1|nr:30S ribosomal protein S1 [bacterium]MDP6527522.1 S1 RNA-binding domain-containing protein [Candidatus Paceibacterota bacterium]MDP6659877.1 S1 RNA-binding domain-containing protein [Candidatus Paceibacterota bacterium]|tara:strand:- start:25384 stop:26511 length:1128 start_codon:yes stop_codon:yes gene_type:complete
MAENKDLEVAEDATKKGKKETFMGSLFHQSPTPPSIGDLVEGPVIAVDRARVYIDLPPFGTGIIYGKEFMSARDILRKVNIGDTIAAKVIDPENKDGYVEVSLKEARQALIWAEAEETIAEKKTFELVVKEANKGGLIIEWQGIQGFLPASQLAGDHYPRVEDGDKDRILEELKQLINEKLVVTIITADPKENKLIFSEKSGDQKERGKIIANYNIGDEVEGEVTGAVEFGIFVKLEEGLEGLVHISEIDWALVEDPRTIYKVGAKVKVKVIEIKDGKISLSIKALKANPWKSASEKYKKDSSVKGVVIKYNKHGALASIEEGVAGLVHISEFESEEELRESLELGKTYDFNITLFDPVEQKMTLSYKNGDKKED